MSELVRVEICTTKKELGARTAELVELGFKIVCVERGDEDVVISTAETEDPRGKGWVVVGTK